MTADEAIAALELPAAARIDRRVPKTLLLEHGAPTVADKRHVNDGIERIHWVAALKPATIGVAAYRDEIREYLEIAVLHLTLRSQARATRLIELLHRAVPYPVVVVTEQEGHMNLSLAHKRRSQGQVGKTVLDGDPVAVDAPHDGESYTSAFEAALDLGRQPRTSLLALYQGWFDTLIALEAARLSGGFAILDVPEHKAARREALGECVRLEAELARLRSAAAREKQISRQVELNLELKGVESARAEALARL